MKRKHPTVHVHEKGYEYVSHRDGSGKRRTVFIHRLAAVAWFGFDAVAGNDVHHETGHPRDNREEALSIKGHAEHRRDHAAEQERDEQGRFA